MSLCQISMQGGKNKMSVNKQNGFLHFLRVNIYYILVVVALAVMIAIIAITSNQEVQLASTQAVQEEQTEVADVNATPVAPTYKSRCAFDGHRFDSTT